MSVAGTGTTQGTCPAASMPQHPGKQPTVVASLKSTTTTLLGTTLSIRGVAGGHDLWKPQGIAL